ncbi:MAG: pilin [Candidatus Magasanikbacteria bacterium]
MKKFLVVRIIFIIGLLFLLFNQVNAATTCICEDEQYENISCERAEFLVANGGCSCVMSKCSALSSDDKAVDNSAPLDSDFAKLGTTAANELNPAKFTSLAGMIGRAIWLFVASVGSIALVLYIYGGFLWMTAMGNSEQINKAKDTIIWTSLGVVAILSSYIIVSFVFNSMKGVDPLLDDSTNSGACICQATTGDMLPECFIINGGDEACRQRCETYKKNFLGFEAEGEC